MIAHEIRTPVSLIIGPLEKIMKSPVSLPSTVRDDLNIIDRNSQRLLFPGKPIAGFPEGGTGRNENEVCFPKYPPTAQSGL